MKRIVSLVKPQKLMEAAATKECQENNTFFKSNRQFTLLTGLSLLLPRSQVCWVLSSALDLIILPLRHALSDPLVCGCEFTACFCYFFFKNIKRSWKVLRAEKERRGRRNKRQGAELTGREGEPDQVPPQGRRLPHLYRWLFMVEPGWPRGGTDPDMGLAGSPKCTVPDSGGGCHSTLLGGTPCAPGWLPDWASIPFIAGAISPRTLHYKLYMLC